MKSHLNLCNTLSIPRNYTEKSYDNPKSINLKRGRANNLGMSPKKIHEVERLSTLIGNEFDHHFNLIDVGSGQGYLSRTLSRHPFNFNVLAIDSNDNNVKESITYDQKRDKASCTIGRLDHVTAHLDKESLNYNNKKWLNDIKSDERSTLIGLHPCGDLSVDVIKAFVEGINEYDGLILVACCHNRVSASNFPLSNKLQSLIQKSIDQNKWDWNYDSFSISVHSLSHWTTVPENYWQKARFPMLKLLYRSRLAQCLRNVGRPHFSENRLGKLRDGVYTSWNSYLEAASQRLKLNFDDLDDHNENEQYWKTVDFRMKVFWTSKARIGDIYETIILIDRYLHLIEQTKSEPHTDVSLLPIFDIEMGSSRNMILTVDRKSKN